KKLVQAPGPSASSLDHLTGDLRLLELAFPRQPVLKGIYRPRLQTEDRTQLASESFPLGLWSGEPGPNAAGRNEEQISQAACAKPKALEANTRPTPGPASRIAFSCPRDIGL